MGYSVSPKTLDKAMHFVEPLKAGHELLAYRWHFPDGARELAYKIREALSIAKRFPGEYPELARAADQFRIEVLDNDNVQAVQKRNWTTQVMAMQASGNGSISGATVTQGMEYAGRPHELVGPLTAVQVIGFWQEGQPSNGPFTFPGSQLDQHEMEKLYEWATEQGWWVFYGMERITLQRPTRDLEGQNWVPSDGLD